MLADNMLMSSIGAGGMNGTTGRAYVDDVFSAYTYTGNGSTQTITNGIDLLNRGGLVWTKKRSGAYSHVLFNSTNLTKYQQIDTSAYITASSDLSFTSTGISLAASSLVNNNGDTYVSWTFRKAPKFFDIVTYVGDGVAGRQIPHQLGVAPGMVIVKNTSVVEDWQVYHRSLGGTKRLLLNLTNAEQATAGAWNNTDPTSTFFTVYSDSKTNAAGNNYVAYLFAHDTDMNGIIQCGTVNTAPSGIISVNLGWEPQYILFRLSANTDDWHIVDTSRKLVSQLSGASGYARDLTANTSAAEADLSKPWITSTGFSFDGSVYGLTVPLIYMAIRRPNKPPLLGTQVYEPTTFTGNATTQTIGTMKSPDLAILKYRNTTIGHHFFDRSRGDGARLNSSDTTAEQNQSLWLQFSKGMNVTLGTDTEDNLSGQTEVAHFFKRTPGVFDIVCYTGTGSNAAVTHNLGVVPDLIILKKRSAIEAWFVNANSLPSGNNLRLNESTSWTTLNPGDAIFSATSAHTSTAFNVLSGGSTSSATYVAYLFASKPGVSKVSSYVGNGGSLVVDCWFNAAARFVMIKRTDSTGDWFIFDTVRGMTEGGNDPHLSLNTTAAEVTTDNSIDPYGNGFKVVQNATTNLNVTNATYIFLAMA